MAGELFGKHRAVVLDNIDPGDWGRIYVDVPDAQAASDGGFGVWAMPSEAPNQQYVARRLPAVGDTVFVEFEGGDAAYPVYDGGHALSGEHDRPATGDGGRPLSGEHDPTATGDGVPAPLYGTYRAVVLSNLDPQEYGRVYLTVPDLAAAGELWATPSESPHESGLARELPAIGDQVYVEFEAGDPQRAVYDGGRPVDDAGYPSGDWDSTDVDASPESHALYGTYPGVVVDDVDPTDAGRVQVIVASVTGSEPRWAAPSEAPGHEGAQRVLPGVGDEVQIDFEDGDPDRPVYAGGHLL